MSIGVVMLSSSPPFDIWGGSRNVCLYRLSWVRSLATYLFSCAEAFFSSSIDFDVKEITRLRFPQLLICTGTH